MPIAVIAHLIAGSIIRTRVPNGTEMTKSNMVLVSGAGLLFFTLMFSQVMESVTRAYYARSDLDLILSSPASARRLFAIRTGAIAVSILTLSALIAGSFINMLMYHDGRHWLSAYAVMGCFAAVATSIAVILVLALFYLVGPKRTHLISQSVAAIVGADFIVGIQAVAIFYYGSISRLTIFQSPDVVASAHGMRSYTNGVIDCLSGLFNPVALWIHADKGGLPMSATVGGRDYSGACNDFRAVGR